MTQRYEKYVNPDMTVDEMIRDPEIKFGAFRIWLRYYRQEEISERIENFLTQPLLKPDADEASLYKYIYRGHDHGYRQQAEPEKSWLKAIRQALFLSATAVGARINLKRGVFSKLEKNEVSGTITLHQLRQAAGALDCDLVYAILPRDQKPPAQRIWEILYPHACKTKFVPNVHKAQRINGIATAARLLMEDMAFRQGQGWSTQNKVSEGGVFREISRRQAERLFTPKA